MMVTAVMEAGEEVMSFQAVIDRLQGKQDGGTVEERTSAYDAIANWFKENDAAKMQGSEQLTLGALVRQFSTDIMTEDSALTQAALQAMGFSLYQHNILRAFSDEECSLVVKALCNCLLKTEDKSLCTRALWCLAKQNIKPSVVKEEIHAILCSVEKAVQSESSAKSMTVQHESINVIIRLQEQLPDDMSAHAARWGKLILPNLVHTAPRIRERAVHATHLGLVAMVRCRAELVGPLVADLKSTLLAEIIKLFKARNELLMLKVWGYYVTILGKALHRGGSLINSLLGVIELGFKHPQPDVKKAAFNTWHSLINNFSLDLDILSNAKRLKLLMQPFLASSVKFETVAHAKLDAWWLLVRSLGPRLPATFHVVVAPLLQCTLGLTGSHAPGAVTPNKAGSTAPPFMQGFSTPQARTALLPPSSPITPRLNLPSLNGVSAQGFPSVQRRGVCMLAAILGVPVPAGDDSATVVDLLQSVLSSPSIFSKLAPTLVPYVLEVLYLKDETLGDLPLRMFHSLVGQVRGVVEGSAKRDSVGVFTLFMDHLATIVNNNHLPPHTVLKLLEGVSELPKKVLSSSSYHTGSAGVLHGTPALFLMSLLFNPKLIVPQPEERFFTILMRLIECGMSSPATVLGFTQSVATILGKVSESVDNKDALWRMWSTLAEPLLKHISQTNEVNQGDSLEHDFSAVTACLLFPIQRLVPHGLSQPTVKTLLKLWLELYEAFSRSASLVTVAEANQCCEDVSAKLLMQLDHRALEKWHFVDAMSQVCRSISQNIDFSPYTEFTAESPRTPGRRSKKKHCPQGNLTSLVKLVGHVTKACAALCQKQTTLFSPSLSQTDTVHWFAACQALVTAMSDLGRVGITSLIHGVLARLSEPLGSFIHYAASPNIAKKDYVTTIEEKVERLWLDLTTHIQTRYSDQFDSAFLAVMAPSLEAAFTHKKRSMRNSTLIFWTATFGQQEELQYPDSLKPCLAKLRERSEIALPGWVETQVIGETPVSQEADPSQSGLPSLAAPVIPNFGGPSPQKMHGSFLRRTEDAKKLMVASSPVKQTGLGSPVAGGVRGVSRRGQTYSPGSAKRKQFASPMATDAAKRRLHVDEDSKMEFVVIASSPSKKRVLTEHQREVLSTKRVSLALYNDLEQSQDTQAFKDFSQTQTQSQPPSPKGSPKEQLDQPAVESNFSFSKEISEQSRPDEVEKAEVGESKADEAEREMIVDDSSQSSRRKPARRVVTFFQPVAKPSSPIKDAGQISLDQDSSKLSEAFSIPEEKQSTQDEGVVVVTETQDERGSESSMVLIEDTCEDSMKAVNAQEEEKSVEMKDVEDVEEQCHQEEEFVDVPETQEEPQQDNEGDVGEAEVMVESTVESPSRDDQPAAVSESPVQDSDPQDLKDVLLDGRFQKVISTPVIKLQRLSQRELEQHTPTKTCQSESSEEDDQEEVVEEKHLDRVKDRHSSPHRMPVLGEASPEGTPRFRRYRSDETHVRNSTPKRSRRRGSVQEVAQSEEMTPSRRRPLRRNEAKGEEPNILQASQKDLAELAEKYELDGIAPLGDDLDRSFEENLSTENTGAMGRSHEGRENHSKKKAEDVDGGLGVKSVQMVSEDVPKVEQVSAADVVMEENVSSEDLFGTCGIASQKQISSAGRPSCDDSFSSEDELPLISLKTPSQSSAKSTSEGQIKISDKALDDGESEDSEVDFPSMMQVCSENKISPKTETPPRVALSEQLTGIKEKPDSSSKKGVEEPLTVTRSGRKCRPSSKIRFAKEILRRALQSPEQRRKMIEGERKHKEETVSPPKISPKVLRSGKIAKKDKSPEEMRRKTRKKKQSKEKSDTECTEDTQSLSTALDMPMEELSSYAISPKSLRALAEKVAQELSPPKVRSARKPQPSSPLGSEVTSSQALQTVRSGRVSKRSKSPVSQRLRMKRLGVTPGPRQTRAGTRLSRVEIKKKNKKRKGEDRSFESKEVTDERPMSELKSTKDIPDKVGEDEALGEPETAAELIVIKDTMSQGNDEDITLLEEQNKEVEEESDTREVEATKEEKQEEKTIEGMPSQNIDDDGDVEMKDLEEQISQPSEDHADVRETTSGADPVEDKINKDDENVQKDNHEHNSNIDDVLTLPTELGEQMADQEQPGREKEVPVITRSKRSSQKLEFGSRCETMAGEKDMLEQGEEGEEDIPKLSQESEVEDEVQINFATLEQGDELRDDIEDVKDEAVNKVVEDEMMPNLEKEEVVATAMETDAERALTGGTAVGVMSSGLDVQESDADIVNSSQSPMRFSAQLHDLPPEDITDSPSPRLIFPNLSPSEEDNVASPNKPKMAAVGMETLPSPQVSPIIPTKFAVSVQGSPEGARVCPTWPNQVNSPEGSIPHMYSPNASPSSGILKNRDGPANTSFSPSSKNRRVSFAEKVFIEPEPLQDGSSGKPLTAKLPESSCRSAALDAGRLPLPPSPLVTTATSRVLAHNSKYITTPSKGSPDTLKSSSSSSSSSIRQRSLRKEARSGRVTKNKARKTNILRSSYASKVFNMAMQAQEGTKMQTTPQGSPTHTQGSVTQGSLTQGSLTQGSPRSQGGVDSSLEAREGSQGSVYPSLLECSLPVEGVLPRLTSSMWSRGLGQLVRAKNIRTIGDLSALSPMQVQSLPIKSPKVSHLKKVLAAFQNEKFPDSKVSTEPSGTPSESTNNDDQSSTPPGRPRDPMSGGRRSRRKAVASSSASLSPPRSPQHIPGGSLVSRLEQLAADFQEAALESIPTSDLFQAHGHVNALMDTIVGALKMKCHSPSMNKDA